MADTKGRPTKLTPEVRGQILAKLRNATPLAIAAESCGVSRFTINEWMRRGEDRDGAGRDDSEPYRSFALEARQAMAQAAEAFHRLVVEGAIGKRPSSKRKGRWVKSKLTYGNIERAQWLLSRRFPEHYGAARENLAVTIEDSAEDAARKRPTVTIVYGKPDDDG